MKPLALVLLALLCFGCDNTPQPNPPKDAVDLVLADNEITGWTRSSAMEVCENATQLLALIDGEGQTYIDNGFVKSAFQDYTGTIGGNTVPLALRVFDMADTAHARTVYAAVATGSETPWTGDNPGDEARIEQSLFAYRVDFREDKFYLSVSIDDATDAGLSTAKLFLLNVSDAIRDTTD
jgi:hypothetical protein